MQVPESVPPFDRAADARILLGGALAAAGDRRHGVVELARRARQALAVAHGIDPAAILQLERAVEAEEIRRAGRVISARDRLRPVDEIGEGEALGLGQAL